jgi:glycosyltransferase involved in cell wall biosynthesis
LPDVASPEHQAEHLVCVTTSAELGGAETSLLTLLQALRRAVPRWRITVIAPDSGPLFNRCRESGIQYRIVPYPPELAALGEPRYSANGRGALGLARAAMSVRPYLKRLSEALAELDATIIHSNGTKAHVGTAFVAPKRARLVWHIHEYLGARRVTAQLLRKLSARPALIVVNSDSVQRDVVSALGSARVVRRIHNAVDLSVFCPHGDVLDLDEASGLVPEAGLVRIGLVATFGRWKGHEVFLDALAALPPDLPVRGYVIGGPVYRTSGSQRTLDQLRGYSDTLGLGGRVGFTGHLVNVPAAMRALDVIVHASTCPEPFGMVIAEGMASGRAVVAVRDGGARELYEENVDALGHAMGDSRDLARQLRRLVADPALRAGLGQSARLAAQRRFSPDRMATEFLEAYAA